MDNANVQIRELKQKISSIVSRYKQLQIDAARLKEQNGNLAAALGERDKKIEEIQNKNINLQLSRALGKGGAGETDLKHRLDEYIIEIEAIIAHLKD